MRRTATGDGTLAMLRYTGFRSYVAKSTLAQAAAQAAGTAVAVLKGKEVLLHRLEDQSVEAQKAHLNANDAALHANVELGETVHIHDKSDRNVRDPPRNHRHT